MSEIRINRCKCCGAKFNPNDAVGGVITCNYCGSSFTLPKDGAPARLLDFLDMGEHELDTARFDEALTSYKKAAEIEKTEPEAYFGMALAKFKVQYLKDEVKNRLQPICHEATAQKFSADKNYLKALKLATPEQAAEYARRAEDIDYIQSEFFKLKKSGLDYNCFICVKVTDEGERTEDSRDADYIYRLLKDKGYKPFYSEYEIRNKQGEDYEAHILYALYSSECMLVVCRNEDFLQTKWVKNEYSRFLKLVNDEEKESDSITIVFNGKPIERLPGRKGKLQGINFALRSADGQIVDFVESHTPEARKKRAAAAEAKQQAEEEQQKRIRELEEQIERLKSSSGAAAGLSEEDVRELISRFAAEQPGKKGDAAELEKLEKQRKALEEQQKKQADDLEKQRKSLEEQQKQISEQLAKLQSAAAPAAPAAGSLSDDELLERMERARAERERKKREEEERKAREKAERERKAREKAEAERIAHEEQERKRREEVEAKNKWTEENAPTIEHYKRDEFVIFGATLSRYTGSAEQVLIPQGVEEIADSAFKGYKKLKAVKFPAGLKKIGEGAFNGCTALSEIKLPESLTVLEREAFGGCPIKEVTLPAKLTEFGNAFGDCKKLKTVTIKKNSKKLTVNGLRFLPPSLEKVIVEEGNAHYVFKDGCLIDVESKMLLRGTKNSVIPDDGSVVEIGDFAFGDIPLKSVTIPSPVHTIGVFAFDTCTKLEEVIIEAGDGSNKRKVYRWAFDKCVNLKKVSAGADVVFDPESFRNCPAFEKFNRSKKRPLAATVIPTKAERERMAREEQERKLREEEAQKRREEEERLRKIMVNSPTLDCYDRSKFEISSGELKKYLGSDVAVKIPMGVTRIGEKAFDNCRSITSLTVPSSVTSSGRNAFNMCINLKSVFISDMAAWCRISFEGAAANPLNYAGTLCLNGVHVRNVEVPDDVTVLSAGAFSFNSLESIKLPVGLKTIGPNAFFGCENLKEITIPDGVTAIGRLAFAGCKGLTRLKFPAGVTVVEDNTCFGCASLEEVILPEGVTKIDTSAFEACKSLKKIVIPASVKELSFFVFKDCDDITVCCRAPKKPDGWHKSWDEVKSGNMFTRKRARVTWNFKG